MSASSLFALFFNHTATTEIYTLSLHDALPIFESPQGMILFGLRREVLESGAVEPSEVQAGLDAVTAEDVQRVAQDVRSEEHTSELQSRVDLVCRLLLEKKKKNK